MLIWMGLLACTGGETPPVDTAPPATEEIKPPEPPEPPLIAFDPVEDTLNTTIGPLVIHPDTHGTLWLDAAGHTLWVDPWTKAKLEGPKADVIVITGIHFDHLDTAAIEKVRKPETVILAPESVAVELRKAKIEAPIEILKNGETKELVGVSFEAVPMYNLVRGPEEGKLYHDKGRGNGYILTFGNARLYIAGDTECTDEMKALKDITVALVPMNLPYTMTPAEAATCVTAFAPTAVYPYHYFGSDLKEFETPVKAAGIAVRKREWYPNGSPFESAETPKEK